MEGYVPELLMLEPFELEQHLVGKNPAIKITFSIKNTGAENCYTVLPCECTVEAFSKLLLRTTILPSGLSVSIRDTPTAQRGTYPVTRSTNLLPQMSTTYSQIILLDSNFLRIISEEFENPPPGKRDMELVVGIALPAIESAKTDGVFKYSGGLINYYARSRLIKENDWLKWLQSWGYQISLLYLPEETVGKVRELMKKRGFVKECDVVSTALQKLDGKEPRSLLLRGNATNRTLFERIRTLIDTASKRLYIAMQYLDTQLLNELIKAVDRSIDVKIITAEPDQKWFRERDRRGIGLRELSKHLQLRKNRELHCRMIIADQTVMVGSADIDTQGLTVHDNVAIETDDPTVVRRAKEEFDDIFENSEVLDVKKYEKEK